MKRCANLLRDRLIGRCGSERAAMPKDVVWWWLKVDGLLEFANEASRRCSSCALRILFGFRASFLLLQVTFKISIMIAIRHARFVTHTLHRLSQCRKTPLANPLGADANFVLGLLAQSQ
jgi:hypothetical protein